jgi:hypothetical protein
MMITGARGLGRARSAVLFLLSGVVAGALTGAVLGAVAAVFPPVLRVPAALLLAVAAGHGVVRGRTPWQWDRETPRRWIEYADWRTPVYNGGALGAGFTTRVGFWAAYLPLIAVLLRGGPSYGALVFAGYAATRCAASLAVAAVGAERLTDALVRARPLLSRVADVVLVAGVALLTSPLIP